MRPRLSLLIGACLVMAACSPEATRTRGGSRGADTNNRPATVRMHEGSDEYWHTPGRVGVQHPPLEPARQAREVEQR